jgi:hypothetical protein
MAVSVSRPKKSRATIRMVRVVMGTSPLRQRRHAMTSQHCCRPNVHQIRISVIASPRAGSLPHDQEGEAGDLNRWFGSTSRHHRQSLPVAAMSRCVGGNGRRRRALFATPYDDAMTKNSKANSPMTISGTTIASHDIGADPFCAQERFARGHPIPVYGPSTSPVARLHELFRSLDCGYTVRPLPST